MFPVSRIQVRYCRGPLLTPLSVLTAGAAFARGKTKNEGSNELLVLRSGSVARELLTLKKVDTMV